MDATEYKEADGITLEVECYEKNRLFPDGKIEPDKVGEIIDQRLNLVFEKAPIVENYLKENPEAEAEHSLVLRYPEDSHLIPLLEERLYEKLLRKRKEFQDTNMEITNHTLMNFDPDLNSLEMEVDGGRIISGESMLQHELAHAQAAYEAGQKIVYIVIPFIWDSVDGHKQLKTIHTVTKVHREVDVANKVDIAIAPKFPSSDDLSQAKLILQELDDPFHPLWDRIGDCEAGLPKINGRGLKHEEMIMAFENVWKESKQTVNQPG